MIANNLVYTTNSLVCSAYLAHLQSHDSKTSALRYLPLRFDFDSFTQQLFLESSRGTKVYVFFFLILCKKKRVL